MTPHLTNDDIMHLRTLALPGNAVVSAIIDEVCAVTGLTSTDIRSTTRKPAIAHARWMVMYRARAAGLSLPCIGACLGGMDHTTVAHGIAREKQRRGEA